MSNTILQDNQFIRTDWRGKPPKEGTEARRCYDLEKARYYAIIGVSSKIRTPMKINTTRKTYHAPAYLPVSLPEKLFPNWVLDSGSALGTGAQHAFAMQYPNYTLTESDISHHDATNQFGKAEIRTFSQTNTAKFCASGDIGKGRSTSKKTREEKLDNTNHFVFIDVEDRYSRSCKAYIVPTTWIRKWISDGHVGNNYSVSRAKFLQLVSKEQLVV